MPALSTYAADKALDALFRNVAYVSTQTFVALFTTTPAIPAMTGGVEVPTTGGTNYVRVRLDTLLAAAAGGQILNNALIGFAAAGVDWGTINGAGVADAVAAGNMLAAGALATPKVITAGDIFEFAVSELITALS